MTATTLNRLANIALMSSVLVFGVTAWSNAHKARLMTHTGSDAFHIGDGAPDIRGVRYASMEQTLVVFASTRCKYCISSVSFFNRLKSVAQERKKKRSVVVVFSEPEPVVQKFKEKQGLMTDSVSGMNFDSLGVRSTPTMVLVGQTGKIARTWGGTSDGVEAEVWRAMGLL